MRDIRWLSLALLCVVVVAPPASLRSAAWVAHLDPLPFFAAAGLVVGVLVARAPLRPLAAHSLAVGAGFALVVAYFAWSALDGDWVTRVRIILDKLLAWLDAAVRAAASNDSLMFALTLALLSWTIAYFGAWFLVRAHNPWWAILPAGTVVLLNCSYDWSLLPYFYVYLGASVFLLIASDEWRRRERWAARLVPNRTRFRGVAISGALLVGPLMLLAWQASPLRAEEYVSVLGDAFNPMNPLQTRFERLFSAVQARQGGVRALAFASSITPRGAFELGQTPLLAIQAPKGQYWRANTLDRYTGHSMESSGVAEEPVGPGLIEDAVPRLQAREEMEQHVQVLANQTSAMFAADQPVWVDSAALLEFRALPLDFASLRAASPFHKGDQYTVVSLVSTATVEMLRNAGTEYPDWMARYLQLPDELPQRVRDEAARVVGDATNPYDRATRIEAYLRQMPYTTTDVPVPPLDRDWVDYMLFDARRGYCDYYATAMVVMLRTQGIPARAAQGFATGEWLPEQGRFVVRESHAHTWVEVYFPDYGWIPFEPSASRPLPFRPENTVDVPGLSQTPLGRPGETPPDDTSEALRAMRERGEIPGQDQLLRVESVGGTIARATLALLAALVALALLAAATLWLVWRIGLRGLHWHQRLYEQTVRLAAWCGVPLRPTNTPYEQARVLEQEIPAAAPLATAIAEAYVSGTYGRGASAEQLKRSEQAWRRLRVLIPRERLPTRLVALVAAVPAALIRRLGGRRRA